MFVCGVCVCLRTYVQKCRGFQRPGVSEALRAQYTVSWSWAIQCGSWELNLGLLPGCGQTMGTLNCWAIGHTIPVTSGVCSSLYSWAAFFSGALALCVSVMIKVPLLGWNLLSLGTQSLLFLSVWKPSPRTWLSSILSDNLKNLKTALLQRARLWH